MTALDSAAYGGHANTAEIFLERGADANAWTDDDSSPLHAAATIGHAGVSAILPEAGAGPSVNISIAVGPFSHSRILRLP